MAERCPDCGMMRATRFGGFGCAAAFGEPYSHACVVRQRDKTIESLQAKLTRLEAERDARVTLDAYNGARWRMVRFAACVPGEVAAHGCWVTHREGGDVHFWASDATPERPEGTPCNARAAAASWCKAELEKLRSQGEEV